VANHALGAANRSGSVDQPTGRLTAQAARLTAAGAQLGSGAARSAAVSPRRAADGDEGGVTGCGRSGVRAGFFPYCVVEPLAFGPSWALMSQ
jgi:hypothetical protein